MAMRLRVFAVLAVLAVLVASGAPAVRADAAVVGSLAISSLTAEHEVKPLGIDTATPRLGWVLGSKFSCARGSRRTRS